MTFLKACWRWLSQSKNQKILALIGAGAAAVLSGVWQVYLHISEKSKDTPTVSASSGGIAAGGNIAPTTGTGGIAVVATGSVTIGISLEQYEAGLKRMEQEVRAELGQANAADKDKIALLEKQLTEIEAKLKNPESALEEYKAKLAQAYKAFDELKREILPEQIKQARDALAKGETANAEQLFKQVLTRGTENAAEAAFQLGQLAFGRVDYQTAFRYLKQAVDLQPENPTFLNAAGLINHTVGRYSEAEPLLKRSLAIREKALGPEHPAVATSLNNLAALYDAQGQYAKAEPLLKRSLAIREKALGPEHPDVATSLNNLAELYRVQGQYAKAKAMKARAKAISDH